jgi:hypothetical protein
MFDYNHQNSSCTFAEQTISYLYDEIDVSGKAAVEKHLRICAVCADEITGFGIVRSSILDWQRDEFYQLETPKIEIPNNESKKLPLGISVSNKTQSWIGTLREFLSVSPASVAIAALLLVTVFVGLIVINHNSSGNNQIAVGGDKNATQTSVLPEPENKSEIASINSSNNSTNVNSPEKSSPSNVIKVQELSPKNLQTAAKLPVVKVSNNARAASRTAVAARKTKNSPTVRRLDVSNYAAVNTLSAKAGLVPKLNNIEEEEEETLHLADLLNEVGGK